MKKLIKRIKVLTAGIFWLVILGVILTLSVGLVVDVWDLKMNILSRCLAILLIGGCAAIVFAAIWEKIRKTISQDSVAKQDQLVGGP